MKKTQMAICIGALLLAILIAWHSCKKDGGQESAHLEAVNQQPPPQKKDSLENEILEDSHHPMSAEETKEVVTRERLRVFQVADALIVENQHALLKKYESMTEDHRERWLQELESLASRDYATDDTERQWRLQELGMTEDEVRKERDEMKSLGGVRAMVADIPPPVGNVDELDRNALREALLEIRTMERSFWIVMELADKNLAFREVNEELRIFPYCLQDVRRGGVRFPPNTKEFWKLFNNLYGLMNRPDPTDDDKEKMKQIAKEIHALVKANTPTSKFQMPERKEE